MIPVAKSPYFGLLEVFDPQGRGYISLTEVDEMLTTNGFDEERKAVLELLGYLNSDEKGRISTSEAIKIFEPSFVSLSEPSNVQANFEYFDTNKDNFISTPDLVEASEELGFNIESGQSQIMISTFDKDNDRKLSLEEFSKIFS